MKLTIKTALTIAALTCPAALPVQSRAQSTPDKVSVGVFPVSSSLP
jgi:hypothetical protein